MVTDRSRPFEHVPRARIVLLSTERLPMHVHVRQGSAVAKFWLRLEVRLADNYGFCARPCNQLAKLGEANKAVIQRAWDEHFGC